MDLRIDTAPAPLAALRALWAAYAPVADLYVDRALHPLEVARREGR